MNTVTRSIRQVGLPVEDLDRALGFYQDVLGLPFIERFGPLAFFDLAGIRLLLEETAPAEAVGAPGVLYLSADDITADQAALVEAGVVFLGEPHCIFVDERGVFGSPGEEEWLTFFQDTESNTLALSTRTGAARGSD